MNMQRATQFENTILCVHLVHCNSIRLHVLFAELAVLVVALFSSRQVFAIHVFAVCVELFFSLHDIWFVSIER